MSGWVGLWMRVDATSSRTEAFDNMMDRPIASDTGWARYQVVLDVGPESERVAFGVLLSGAGQARIAKLSLDVVDETVPVTSTQALPRAPRNLSFSQDGD